MKDACYCNFCGKSQHEVRKLIAGPTAFICNECADLCHDIMHDSRTSPAAPLATPPTPPLIPFDNWSELLHTAEMALSQLHLSFSTAQLTQRGYERERREEERNRGELGEVIGFGDALTSPDYLDKPE